MSYKRINDFIDCLDEKHTLIMDDRTYQIDCCEFNFTKNPCASDMAYIRINVEDKFYDNINSMNAENDVSWHFNHFINQHQRWLTGTQGAGKTRVLDVSFNDKYLTMTIFNDQIVGDYSQKLVVMKLYRTQHY